MDKELLKQFGWINKSFDFDRDGKLSDREAIFAMNTFAAMAEARSSAEEKSLFELAASGVDVSSFDFMDADERREAIEDAGLDPEDYDFE